MNYELWEMKSGEPYNFLGWFTKDEADLICMASNLNRLIIMARKVKV